jgi:hypothetical protein
MAGRDINGIGAFAGSAPGVAELASGSLAHSADRPGDGRSGGSSEASGGRR